MIRLTASGARLTRSITVTLPLSVAVRPRGSVAVTVTFDGPMVTALTVSVSLDTETVATVVSADSAVYVSAWPFGSVK